MHDGWCHTFHGNNNNKTLCPHPFDKQQIKTQQLFSILVLSSNIRCILFSPYYISALFTSFSSCQRKKEKGERKIFIFVIFKSNQKSLFRESNQIILKARCSTSLLAQGTKHFSAKQGEWSH